MARWLALVVVALGCASACSRSTDDHQADPESAKPPPVRDQQPPPTLSIAVSIDGAPAPAITADLLRTTKPDFQDAERTAWLIPSLIPGAAPPGTTVEAVSTLGVSVKFGRPSATGLEPALFLTRRSEVIVSALDPKEPFPRYHGQGGRLHRAGDSTPRIAPVARLEITRPTP